MNASSVTNQCHNHMTRSRTVIVAPPNKLSNNSEKTEEKNKNLSSPRKKRVDKEKEETNTLNDLDKKKEKIDATIIINRLLYESKLARFAALGTACIDSLRNPTKNIKRQCVKQEKHDAKHQDQNRNSEIASQVDKNFNYEQFDNDQAAPEHIDTKPKTICAPRKNNSPTVIHNKQSEAEIKVKVEGQDQDGNKDEDKDKCHVQIKNNKNTPENWMSTLDNIRRMRAEKLAPVDTMGCARASSEQDSPKNKRFQILTALVLSSQTKDQVTFEACQRLRNSGYNCARAVADANEEELSKLIYPVGFYRRKAQYMKKISHIIINEFDGEIPNTVEELCKLPGVGSKMAHLCMQAAWNIVTGIGVDTHVHRIAQRLSWVPKTAKTPELTRVALESWLPREYWAEVNHLLVGFGQTICKPKKPQCDQCLLKSTCPSSTIKW